VPVGSTVLHGSLVQIGSFPNEASANAAWARAAARFLYLAPLGKSVQKAEVNGNTVYRLRVNAGSANQASELCGKLKVAGEACFVAGD
jgi:cell division protein FtsN